jgi:sugar (pentulose or hexulose) kinase
MHNINETYLGIELGSTRIKAILIDNSHQPVASGSHAWENRLENGVWTYSLAIHGHAARLLYDMTRRSVKYGVKLYGAGYRHIRMMLGYLRSTRRKQIAPFRTWRNTITGEASETLTGFRLPYPQGWSIAHLTDLAQRGPM